MVGVPVPMLPSVVKKENPKKPVIPAEAAMLMLARLLTASVKARPGKGDCREIPHRGGGSECTELGHKPNIS